MVNKEYALYKGEKLLSIGTIEEIAEEMNVLPSTIAFYKTPSYQKRLTKRKTSRKNGYRILVCLDDEENNTNKTI